MSNPDEEFTPEELDLIYSTVESLMSETSKKELARIASTFESQSKEYSDLLQMYFKFGWMAGTMDCGFKSLRELEEWKTQL